MAAERRCKVDFLVSGAAGGCGIRGAEIRDELRRKHFDSCPTIRFARLDDLRQRRTAKRTQAQKAGAKRGTRFALQICRIRPTERESAGHRPFARFRRFFKNERIRCIELDGTQQLHRFGPPGGYSSIALFIVIYTFPGASASLVLGRIAKLQLQVTVRAMADLIEPGSSGEAARSGPKRAALLAMAAEPVPPVPFVKLESSGIVLI